MDTEQPLCLHLPPGRSPPRRSRLISAVLALAVFGGAWVPASALEYGPLPERIEDATAGIERTPLDAEPIRLDSDQDNDTVMVRVDAILEHPFHQVSQEFRSAAVWCESLFLHINVKACVHHGDGERSGIELYISRKRFQRPENAYRMDLDFRVQIAEEDYLAVKLAGDRGPYGTRDYRMTLEAVPLDAERTLIHVRHAVDYGALARGFLNLYLRFGGGDRVGFTVVGEDDAGRPIYVDGLQGVIERNVMRFYLAFQAYLESLEFAEEDRLAFRMARWFELTERYPEQLRELDENTYLRQKEMEWREQQSLQVQRDDRN